MKKNTEPRIRFNWGYHDGARDEQKNQLPMWEGKGHFDKIYVEGYKAGRTDVQREEYQGDSSQAWKNRPSRARRKMGL